mgnify:CR=1 FL=1
MDLSTFLNPAAPSAAGVGSAPAVPAGVVIVTEGVRSCVMLGMLLSDVMLARDAQELAVVRTESLRLRPEAWPVRERPLLFLRVYVGKG